MTTAFCGFGMGATPNAMANMLSVTGQYGPAPKAFFVVPIVGGMFVDFTNTAVLSVFLNFLPKCGSFAAFSRKMQSAADKPHTGSLSSVFPDTHVAGENGSELNSRLRERTLRGFFRGRPTAMIWAGVSPARSAGRRPGAPPLFFASWPDIGPPR